MTREEAIKFAEHAVNMTDIPEVKEFYRMAAAALTQPTQERVNKAWRGEWEDMREAYNDVPKRRCSRCKRVFIGPDTPFCEACGAPMTDEAVEMVIERWEALNDGKGD